MKKIILMGAFIALSTVSAKAIELPSMGLFSLTGGLASQSSVWGASGKEQNFDDLNTTITETNTAEGVFTESFGSNFVELGIGKYISVGMEKYDSITTPTNVANEGRAAENTVKVKFSGLETNYLKLNIPGGMFLKWGDIETDMDVVESKGDYGKASLSGSSIGAGYERFFGETGFGFRFEGTYHEFDSVTLTDDAANADGDGKNVITASNIEGLSGKIALTYTLGRNY